jgi:DNA-directed RNA polymerase
MDIDKWVYTATHLQRFLDEISNVKSGSPEQKLLKGKGRVKPALVRRRCQEILLAEGYVQDRGDGAQQRPLSMNDFTEWDPVVKVKLGAALIQLLLDHTTYSKSRDVETGEPGPAFFHARKKIGGDSMRFQGFITVHPDLHYLAMKAELEPENMLLSLKFTQNARCQPMVVPPKDWKSVNDGGYESIKVDFMRTRQCKSQKVRHCNRHENNLTK